MTRNAIGLGAALLGGCVIGTGSDARPVELEAGTPTPIGFATREIGGTVFGVVDHDVCIAVDTPEGFVRISKMIDPPAADFGPLDGAAVQSAPPADLDCPAGPQWHGWARVFWGTVSGRAIATLAHQVTRGGGDSSGTGLEIDAGFFEEEPDADFGEEGLRPAIRTGDTTVLEGAAFEGYEVTVPTFDPLSEFGTTYAMVIHADYLAAGELDASPAPVVELALSWVPAEGPTILGGSPGFDAAGSKLRTDVDGEGTLLIDADSLCSFGDFTLFAETPDGGTQLVTTLACPF